MLDRIDGPVIFVANHASHLDTPLILLLAAGRVAAHDRGGRGRRLLLRHLVARDRVGDRLQHLPDRAPRRHAGVDARARCWPTAGTLVVFPEGTRSPDGWMGQFRMGAAFLAVRARRPGRSRSRTAGSFAAMPRGRAGRSPGRRQVTIRFGEPLRPAEGESRARVRAADRGRGRGPARRGLDHLVGVPPSRRGRPVPVPVRSGRRPLAPRLGIHRPDQAGRHQTTAPGSRTSLRPKICGLSAPDLRTQRSDGAAAATAASAA